MLYTEEKRKKNHRWTYNSAMSDSNKNICRLCMCDSSPVFINSAVINMIANACPLLQISENDSLPQKICIQCVKTLRDCDNFRQQCMESDRILRGRNCIKLEQDGFIKLEVIDDIALNKVEKDELDESFDNYFTDNDTKHETQDSLPLEKKISAKKKKAVVKKVDKINILVENKPVNENSISTKKAHLKGLCELCGKYIKMSNMKDHELIHSATFNFSCDLCSKKFKVEGNLRKHLKRMHSDNRATCDICKKVYSGKGSLKVHILGVHSTGIYFPCDICDKKFKYKRLLQLHKRTHTQEKPLQCRFCDSRFAICSSRLDHERLHTGETPYKCPSCPKAFVQLSNMKSHFKYNHKDIVFKEVYKPKARGNMKYFLE